MRTWSGLVDLVVDDAVVGQVHADLATEEREGEAAWWGQLRGTASFPLETGRAIAIRLPDGRLATVAHPVCDPHDVYHRTEVDGVGSPPF